MGPDTAGDSSNYLLQVCLRKLWAPQSESEYGPVLSSITCDLGTFFAHSDGVKPWPTNAMSVYKVWYRLHPLQRTNFMPESHVSALWPVMYDTSQNTSEEAYTNFVTLRTC